jgi:MFS transporter, MHS family, proline/betaine transporter
VTIAQGTGPVDTAAEPGRRRRIIAAGTIGNVLEWYDFSIYGFFAVQIGATFFPGEDAISQALSVFSVFAAGYLARPLGAIAIGHIGDRHGRSMALTVSIAGMIAPTLGMGLLPGHASIGIAAPILLTVLRLIQGLAVGGESAIANVFMIEHAPTGRKALAGAICGASYSVGIQLASMAALACASLLSPTDLQDWGWRIPFWLSLAIALSGFYLRRTLKDLPSPAVQHSSPLAEVLRRHGGLVVRIAGLSLFAAVGFQTAFIYIAEWLQRVNGVSPAETFGVTSFSMLAVTPVSLFFGWLADRAGRRNLLMASAAVGVLSAVPFFMLMQHTSATGILLGQAGFVVVLGVQFGVQGALMVETTPEAIRCTALAIGNNIAWSIVGGLTPLAATWLAWRTGDELSPAYLVAGAAAITWVALYVTKDAFRRGRS